MRRQREILKPFSRLGGIALGRSGHLGDSDVMSPLLECLARELERPRAVTEQVTKHLTETYEVRREDLGGFLVNELPRLEDYEIDLALAPLFTPTLAEQAVV